MEKYKNALQTLIDYEIAIKHKRIDDIKKLFKNSFTLSQDFSVNEKMQAELVEVQIRAHKILQGA
jgi:hypothetical protein